MNYDLIDLLVLIDNGQYHDGKTPRLADLASELKTNKYYVTEGIKTLIQGKYMRKMVTYKGRPCHARIRFVLKPKGYRAIEEGKL